MDNTINPVILNENASSGSGNSANPLLPASFNSATTGFQGWLTQLQNYAAENPALVALFGVGLLVLASQGMLNPPKGNQNK
jgi:hypothetical protein